VDLWIIAMQLPTSPTFTTATILAYFYKKSYKT